MNSSFPLFSNHLELARRRWRELLLPGDTVLDATCGRGHDTLALAQMVLTEENGALWALDIQADAIAATTSRLSASLTEGQLRRSYVELCDHATLPPSMAEVSLKLAVYNLGYLPGGDKSIITTAETTLHSLESVACHIAAGGALSIMCYVGHPGGAGESDGVMEWCRRLPPARWNVCCHRWLNVSRAPLWILCQRTLTPPPLDEALVGISGSRTL